MNVVDRVLLSMAGLLLAFILAMWWGDNHGAWHDGYVKCQKYETYKLQDVPAGCRGYFE